MQNSPGNESSSSSSRYGQSDTDELSRSAHDIGTEIQDHAQSSLNAISHTADKTARRVQSLVNEGDAMLRDRVMQNPMAALGIAALVGALAANAMRRH